MNLLFLLVVLIFILFMIIGYMRGLVKSVCKLVLMVLALLIAYIVTPFATEALIQNTKIDDNIQKKINSRLERYVSDKIREETEQLLGGIADNATVDSLTATYMTTDFSTNEQIRILQDIPFPQFMKDALIEHNNKEEKERLESKGFFDYIAIYLSRMVLRAIVFFGLLICLVIIFTIITKMLSIAAHLPIINSINRIGGVLFGVGEALLVVWILFVEIAMLANTSVGVELCKQVEDNTFLTKLYDSNLLMSLVTIFK